MNDIEVLERLLEEGFSAMCPLEAQAIENLLKERQSDKERIKELEEINEAHKKENGELRERVNKQSLIKEKIEEYINSILENLDEDRRWCDMELVDNFRELEKELLNKNVK